MSKYVGGFVIPLAKANVERYRKTAQKARQFHEKGEHDSEKSKIINANDH